MNHRKEDACEICQVLDSKAYSEPKRQMLHQLLAYEFAILDVMSDPENEGIETDEDEIEGLMNEIIAVSEVDAGVTMN
jgi:ribonuclease HII